MFIKAFYVIQAIVGHHLVSINKYILAYRENAWYALFTNNMKHNVCIALRIYCPFPLQFLSTGVAQRNCTSTLAVLCVLH